jgi:cytochrome c oxidase cbb3-type subunit 3
MPKTAPGGLSMSSRCDTFNVRHCRTAILVASTVWLVAFIPQISMAGETPTNVLKPLTVPQKTIFPNGTKMPPEDPAAKHFENNPTIIAAGEGMYNHFNCDGCHFHGAGGMGPPFMNGGHWRYGGRLDQIYASIYEGRPAGMPAWGKIIPSQEIWYIAAYVKSLSIPKEAAITGGPPLPKGKNTSAPPTKANVQVPGTSPTIPAPDANTNPEVKVPNSTNTPGDPPNTGSPHAGDPKVSVPANSAAGNVHSDGTPNTTDNSAAKVDLEKDARAAPANASAKIGAELIVKEGCGSCHDIPGIHNATGEVGPPLIHMGARTIIAGFLPNTSKNMITWIKNPQAVVPGNDMPDLGLSTSEAGDITAYLYTLR